MNNFKTRTSLTIPTPIYDLLNKDSIEKGISKSTIVTALLFFYYSKNSNIVDFPDIDKFAKN